MAHLSSILAMGHVHNVVGKFLFEDAEYEGEPPALDGEFEFSLQQHSVMWYFI